MGSSMDASMDLEDAWVARYKRRGVRVYGERVWTHDVPSMMPEPMPPRSTVVATLLCGDDVAALKRRSVLAEGEAQSNVLFHMCASAVELGYYVEVLRRDGDAPTVTNLRLQYCPVERGLLWFERAMWGVARRAGAHIGAVAPEPLYTAPS